MFAKRSWFWVLCWVVENTFCLNSLTADNTLKNSRKLVLILYLAENAV